MEDPSRYVTQWSGSIGDRAVKPLGGVILALFIEGALAVGCVAMALAIFWVGSIAVWLVSLGL